MIAPEMWVPTIAPTVIMVFSAGLLIGKLREVDRRQGAHGQRLLGVEREVQSNAVAIAKLEAWRDGYNAATYRHGAEDAREFTSV